MRAILRCLLVCACALLAPAATAAASTSSVTLDGSTLRWAVAGTSDVVELRVPMHGCGAGDPCFTLRDAKSPPAAALPAGCQATQGGVSEFRAACMKANLGRVVVEGDGAGALHVNLSPGALDPGFTCPGMPVEISQRGGDGGTIVRDGCQQAVRCTSAYAGRVEADASDAVDASCRWLVVEGKELRRAPACLTASCPAVAPTPATVAAPDGVEVDATVVEGGRAESVPATGRSRALVRVRVTKRSARTLAVTVVLRSRAPVTLALQRAKGTRWTTVATRPIARGPLKPSVRLRVPVATAGSGRYRVVARVPDGAYPLVSSPLVVR